MIRDPNWRTKELNELKMLYESGAPLKTIAEKLRRTLSAIRTRAQLNRLRRPKWSGSNEVNEMKAYAVKLGLDEACLPTAPTALRILICLAQIDISSKLSLDKACSVGDSARNKAIRILRLMGLVLVDNFCSPAEIVLTWKAFRSRPEPMLAGAILDRLLHSATVLNIQGRSYRLRDLEQRVGSVSGNLRD